MSSTVHRPLMREEYDEEPLLHVDLDPAQGLKESTQQSRQRRDGRLNRHLQATLFLSLLLNVSLFIGGVAIYYTARGSSNPPFPQALYSPAQDVIEYETRIFHEGFGTDRTIYQMPPSPQVDAAWDELYNFGVSRISKSESERLVNSTYRLPGDETHYVVQIDVFHQMHCLNMLRKGLSPEYYPEMRHNSSADLNDLHWGHCLESLRQSLMCSADVSPLVWQWVDRVKEVRLMGNIAHTCRNYEKIKAWGLERRLGYLLNFTGFV